MTAIESGLRQFVEQVINERHQSKPDFKSIADFCTQFGMSRTSVWRAEKNGTIKVMSIGGRKFIDVNQFNTR